MRILKPLGLLFFVALSAAIGYLCFHYYERKSADVITLNATFMQYACGDENDDMQVTRVDNKKYDFLIGKDIDPQVTFIPGTYELKNYFYKNKSARYGMEFKLTGRLSRKYKSGCDASAPKFWVEEIARPDGSYRMTAKQLGVTFLAK